MFQAIYVLLLLVGIQALTLLIGFVIRAYEDRVEKLNLSFADKALFLLSASLGIFVFISTFPAWLFKGYSSDIWITFLSISPIAIGAGHAGILLRTFKRTNKSSQIASMETKPKSNASNKN